MWLLREFVESRKNYGYSRPAQEAGARDAIQTLGAFIEDNSSVKGQSGLAYFEAPQPIIISRAMFQLRELASNKALGSHDVDISRGNLHGISLGSFTPRGSFLAVATDFRRANLTGLDLTAQPATLRGAFLSCANLAESRFGHADLTGADLSGANLAGADLRDVDGLTAKQLTGAHVTAKTQLPAGVSVSRPRWGILSDRCRYYVDRITGMVGGQGYSSAHPCPTNLDDAKRLKFDPPFSGDLDDLVTACGMRLR